MKFKNRNVSIGSSVVLGTGVRIGDNTIVYDNVQIDDNTTICNDCVIGEPPSAYYLSNEFQNPPLRIGANCLIRSHSIVYSGSVIGDFFQTGHRVTIRESVSIGNHCSVGTLSDLQGHLTIGNYCRLHSNVHLGQKTELGNYVFVYPYVVLANDPTPPSDTLIGVYVDDFAQIAIMSSVLPGLRVGAHALVGAGSVVTKDVPAFALATGNPAVVVKDVRDIRSRSELDGDGQPVPHYPWPRRFSRGMPWAGVGFSNWCETEGLDEFGLPSERRTR